MGCSSEAEQVTVNHQVEICLTASSVATRQSSCKHGFVLTAPSGRNSPSQPTMPHGVMVNTMFFGAIVPGSSPGGATIKCFSSSVGSEHLATNEEVAGSSPAWSTK